MTGRPPGDDHPPVDGRPPPDEDASGEEATGRDASGIADDVGDRAMAGDPAAQRQIDEAWDASEPMSGEAPTG